MNYSDALLEAVAKYAFEIGLKPLKNRFWLVNRFAGSLPNYLLLLAELVFVVQQFKAVKDVIHSDQGVRKVL